MVILTEAEEVLFSAISQKLINHSNMFDEVDKCFLISNEKELKRIEQGQLFNLEVTQGTTIIPQACHIVSSYLWLTGQVETLCTGFAMIDEECVTNTWYHHSFCIHQNKIIEPTTLERNKYFGIELDLQESIDLCLDTIHWFDQFRDELKISRAEIETFNRYLILAKGI